MISRGSGAAVVVVLSLLVFGGVSGQEIPRQKARAQAVAAAGARKPAVWEQEPTGFMGIKFGQPLAGQIPECPKEDKYRSYDNSRIYAEKIRCFKVYVMAFDEPAIYELANPPDIGIRIWNVYPGLVDGNFEGMSFYFRHYDYMKMLELFRARYGAPTRVETGSYQCSGWMSLTGQINTWKGKAVTVTVSEYGIQADEGSVSVATRTFHESVDSENKRNAIRHRDKL